MVKDYIFVYSEDVKVKKGEKLGEACVRRQKELKLDYWINPPGMSQRTDFYVHKDNYKAWKASTHNDQLNEIQ